MSRAAQTIEHHSERIEFSLCSSNKEIFVERRISSPISLLYISGKRAKRRVFMRMTFAFSIFPFRLNFVSEFGVAAYLSIGARFCVRKSARFGTPHITQSNNSFCACFFFFFLIIVPGNPRFWESSWSGSTLAFVTT